MPVLLKVCVLPGAALQLRIQQLQRSLTALANDCRAPSYLSNEKQSASG